MAVDVHITTSVRGPLFTKKLDETVRKAIYTEAVDTIATRLERNNKRKQGLGIRRNTITRTNKSDVSVAISSTRGGKAHWPRVSGTAWVSNRMIIAIGMTGRVLNGVAKRIISELG